MWHLTKFNCFMIFYGFFEVKLAVNTQIIVLHKEDIQNCIFKIIKFITKVEIIQKLAQSSSWTKHFSQSQS